MSISTAKAEEYCRTHGHRFTEPRRRVLAAVNTAEAPLSAYDVIDRMPPGTKPPTVYRALQFWEQEGFIHRIGSLNLYVACEAGHRHGGAQFLVCGDCGRVEEIHLCQMPESLGTMAHKAAFAVTQWNAELHGTCRDCRT